MYPRFSLNLHIQKLHPFALQSYQFLGLIKHFPYVFPNYTRYQNLWYILVVTHVRSNHANFQRFWPIDKGAESFEIRPPTVHSNFSVESKNQLHKQEKWHSRVLAFNICQLSMFPMHIHRNGRFSSVFQCNKLNSDFKKFPGKMTGV